MPEFGLLLACDLIIKFGLITEPMRETYLRDRNNGLSDELCYFNINKTFNDFMNGGRCCLNGR